jgi:hypothetical protein
MKSDNGGPPRRPIWTYGYIFTPPIARSRIGPMEALLLDGHRSARLVSHTWEGRLVNGDFITHLLVVCDTPKQDLEINRLLEAELLRLEAPFALTASVALVDPP